MKTGAKDALVEDIDKGLKDTISSLAELEQKLSDADKILRGFEEVVKAMSNNPDYESRQTAIQKMAELNTQTRSKKDDIEKEKKIIEG